MDMDMELENTDWIKSVNTLKYKVADTVFLKVNVLYASKIREYHRTFLRDKNLLITDRAYGHIFDKKLHIYALDKHEKNIIYQIFTPNIGTIKEVYDQDYDFSKIKTQKYQEGRMLMGSYLVKWQPRDAFSAWALKDKQEEVYYEQNLISMHEIEKFLPREQLADYCMSICNEKSK